MPKIMSYFTAFLVNNKGFRCLYPFVVFLFV